MFCGLFVPLSISSRFSVYTGLDMLKGLLVEKVILTPAAGTPVIPDMTNIPVMVESVMGGASAALISPLEIIWLAGMCVCVLFFVVAYIKFIRQFKQSLPVENDIVSLWLRENPLRRTVEIRQSDRITAPLTYNVFRPVVLFPKDTDWADEAKLRYVLAHEFTHIRRFDALTKLVLINVVCVHWFNPLVWAMFILANRDIELSCDETVVKSFGETAKSAYALTLIGLAEKKGHITPLVNHFGKNAIEERIIAIMKIKKTTLAGITFALTLIVGTTTIFATSADSSTSNSDTNNQQGQNVIFAEKITDFDSNKDITFTENPDAKSFHSYSGSVGEAEQEGIIANPEGFSFSSVNGTDDGINHSVDFDVEQAIKDIESGKIKPLSKDNLPGEIDKDKVADTTFTMIDENGNKTDVTSWIA